MTPIKEIFEKLIEDSILNEYKKWFLHVEVDLINKRILADGIELHESKSIFNIIEQLKSSCIKREQELQKELDKIKIEKNEEVIKDLKNLMKEIGSKKSQGEIMKIIKPFIEKAYNEGYSKRQKEFDGLKNQIKLLEKEQNGIARKKYKSRGDQGMIVRSRTIARPHLFDLDNCLKRMDMFAWYKIGFLQQLTY